MNKPSVARTRIAQRARSGDPRRITIICNDADYFLRHRRATADALADAGHHVRVVTGGQAIGRELSGKWQAVHIPIARWTFDPRADIGLFVLTLREVFQHKPDTLHLITLKPIVFSGLAAVAARFLSRRRMQIVATVPGLGRLMSPASAMKGRASRLSRFLVQRSICLLARRKDVCFTFETASDRDAFVNGGIVPAKNALVISGAGVSPDEFYPGSQRDPARPLRVLFASRLMKSKGLDVFLHSARSLRHRADVEFLVAGLLDPQDPDAVPLEQLEGEPSIRFLGARTDMPDLLRQVDVVSLPTRYGEGIPRILIEAAATGIASIASDHEGCREIVDDGRTGVIIPERPVAAAARAMTDAILRYRESPDLLHKHGKAARSKFLDGDYAEENVVAQFVALLVNNGPGPERSPGS